MPDEISPAMSSNNDVESKGSTAQPDDEMTKSPTVASAEVGEIEDSIASSANQLTTTKRKSFSDTMAAKPVKKSQCEGPAEGVYSDPAVSPNLESD